MFFHVLSFLVWVLLLNPFQYHDYHCYHVVVVQTTSLVRSEGILPHGHLTTVQGPMENDTATIWNTQNSWLLLTVRALLISLAILLARRSETCSYWIQIFISRNGSFPFHPPHPTPLFCKHPPKKLGSRTVDYSRHLLHNFRPLRCVDGLFGTTKPLWWKMWHVTIPQSWFILLLKKNHILVQWYCSLRSWDDGFIWIPYLGDPILHQL